MIRWQRCALWFFSALIAATCFAAAAAAETDAALEVRMIEYLAGLDKAKLDQVSTRVGVEPSAAFYNCLCPTGDGYHYFQGGPAPCRRIGPLGGPSWREFDTDAAKWRGCVRSDAGPLLDALISHVRISQSLQRPDISAPAAPIAGAAIPIDEMANLPKAEYKPHPVFAKLQALKDACLPVPGDDAFKPWSHSFTRDVTGRHQEVLDQLEQIIDGAPDPCEAAYAGKLFVDGQAGLYTEEIVGSLAWEFFGPDEWSLGEKGGEVIEWIAKVPGAIAGNVGRLGLAADVKSAGEMLDKQWQIDGQNRQYLEAKTLLEESRTWNRDQVSANVGTMSLELEESRKKVAAYRETLSNLRIELFRKYQLDRLGPCHELNPIPACTEFALEFKQRGAETNYHMRTETFKAYGVELKRNLLRDVRRELIDGSCEEFIEKRRGRCEQ